MIMSLEKLEKYDETKKTEDVMFNRSRIESYIYYTS